MYREGELVVRTQELEAELVEAKQEVKSLERELYATRRRLRAKKWVRTTSRAGLGAGVGNILGAIAWGLSDIPHLLVIGACVGFVFGAILGSFEPPDDDFPDAPKPRLY